jgi:hypothetical protein
VGELVMAGIGLLIIFASCILGLVGFAVYAVGGVVSELEQIRELQKQRRDARTNY